MKEYTLPIAFLLAPFAILSTGYIWTGQQIGLMIIFLVLMAGMIENRWLRGFLFYVIAWQTVLFVQAMIHPGMFQSAIASGYTQALFMTAGAMIYLTALKSKLPVSTFYNFICIAALIQILIAIPQRYMGFDLVRMALSLIAPTKSIYTTPVLVGTLGNSNYLAAFLAFSVPFFFRKWWIWSLPLVAVALYFSMSSAAVIAAIIVGGFFVAKKYRGWKWMLLSVAITVLLVAGYIMIDSPGFVNERFHIWTAAFNQVVQWPLGIAFGLGPGAAWAQNYPLHSEWVTLFHQFGVIGIILAVGYLLTVSRKNIYLFSSFVIIVINMFGNAALHIAPTAFLACMVAGLMERERSQGNV